MAAERIDVRALIKKAADVLDEDYFQMAAVEAAVAELIEADKEYDAALEAVNMLHHRAAGDHVGFLNHKIGTEARLKAAKERRAAALARMGEGA